MWPELHRSLSAIRASIAPQHFDPRTDSTSWGMAITDSVAAEAVCGITVQLRTVPSPSARIAFALHTNAGSLEADRAGTLDQVRSDVPGAAPRGPYARPSHRPLCLRHAARARSESTHVSRPVRRSRAHVLGDPVRAGSRGGRRLVSACRAAPGRSSPWSIDSPTRFASGRKAIS